MLDHHTNSKAHAMVLHIHKQTMTDTPAANAQASQLKAVHALCLTLQLVLQHRYLNQQRASKFGYEHLQSIRYIAQPSS